MLPRYIHVMPHQLAGFLQTIVLTFVAGSLCKRYLYSVGSSRCKEVYMVFKVHNLRSELLSSEIYQVIFWDLRF